MPNAYDIFCLEKGGWGDLFIYLIFGVNGVASIFFFYFGSWVIVKPQK